jgi:hypothetical protein
MSQQLNQVKDHKIIMLYGHGFQHCYDLLHDAFNSVWSDKELSPEQRMARLYRLNNALHWIEEGTSPRQMPYRLKKQILKLD